MFRVRSNTGSVWSNLFGWQKWRIIVRVNIRPIPPTLTHPLRQAVLRPGQPTSTLIYPSDDLPSTLHLGLFGPDTPSNEPLGIASFYDTPMPDEGRLGDWRLRGMAVAEGRRGLGIGRRLVEVGLEHIRKRGGTRLWCNARVSAKPFYEKLGFTVRGDVFDIPTIGPHYLMAIKLT